MDFSIHEIHYSISETARPEWTQVTPVDLKVAIGFRPPPASIVTSCKQIVTFLNCRTLGYTYLSECSLLYGPINISSFTSPNKAVPWEMQKNVVSLLASCVSYQQNSVVGRSQKNKIRDLFCVLLFKPFWIKTLILLIKKKLSTRGFLVNTVVYGVPEFSLSLSDDRKSTPRLPFRSVSVDD